MDIQELDWDTFLARLKWKQGEHMTLVGPTGGGKTTLARLLLDRRKYIVVFATKRRDPLLTAIKQDGDYEVVKDFIGNTKISEKFILDPGTGTTLKATKLKHRAAFQAALETAYHQEGWCVYVDEGKYICDTLRLDQECEMIWQQGRSLGVTLVMSVQRPVKIPLAAYDQATHVFFWRETDDANLKRIGGIGGISNRLIRDTVSVLEWHEVLYLNTRSGEMVKTKAKVK